MPSAAIRALRSKAAARTLFEPTDLASAITRLRFVQADPIRAPARAQDLILRQRVRGYRAGDLERGYPTLGLVEDMVHVYGFLQQRDRALLHPRRLARRFHVEDAYPGLREAIVAHLRAGGDGHPRAIERALVSHGPRAALTNAWGGQSSATTRMLDVLHYRGLLRVVRRDRGVRVYGLTSARGGPAVPADREPVAAAVGAMTPQRRADGLILLLSQLYAPLPKASLGQLTLMLGERAIARDALRARIPALVRRGLLTTTAVDGVEYVDIADDPSRPDAPPVVEPVVEPVVRFLAPFDPLVWDRRRFEHLWQWRYRFEAYVPAARRTLGYYALPLLWQTPDDARVIGWVNASTASGRLVVTPGFVERRPAGVAFRAAYDAEVARLDRFLARDEPAE